MHNSVSLAWDDLGVTETARRAIYGYLRNDTRRMLEQHGAAIVLEFFKSESSIIMIQRSHIIVGNQVCEEDSRDGGSWRWLSVCFLFPP